MRIVTIFLFIFSCYTSMATAETAPIIPIVPEDSEIAQIYVSMLDRDIAKSLKTFNTETGLIDLYKPANPVHPDPSVASLPRMERKVYAKDSRYSWSGTQTRYTARIAGAMGCAYGAKSSTYYKDPLILSHIVKILNTFGESQSDEGDFVFSPIHFSTVYGTHEAAWRLEPLITAYEAVKEDLTDSDRARFRKTLERNAEFLRTHECSSYSNRGMVWCAVMSLCYRFTGDSVYLNEANRVFEWCGRLFNWNGEVREGPGPDMGYSTISLQYLFLYRLMSGNEALDETLVRSLKWYTRLFTTSGVPFEGMTTRQWTLNSTRVASVLGALNFYANRDPSFAQLANCYLEAMEEKPAGFTTGNGGAHFLRGAMYHKPPEQRKEIPLRTLRATL